MRALLLVHNLPERGSYFRAVEIARRLARRGHETALVCTSDSHMYRLTRHVMHDDDAHPGVQFVRWDAPYRTLFNDRQEGWGILDNSFRLSQAFGSRWDMVYGFSHKPDCVLPALAAKVRGAKIVLDWSDWWGTPEGLLRACVIPSDQFQAMPRPIRLWRRAFFQVDELLEPKVYRLADAVTLISEEYLRHPRAPRGLADKSLVMHSGSPLAQIRPVDKAGARRAMKLEFPPGAVVLGYLANFHTSEVMLMDAFAKVCQARDDVWLAVVGSGFERAEQGVHEATRHRVRHLGRKPFGEIGTFLGACDALLLPLTDFALDRARYPHKLSDYVSAGRPVIACDVGETGRLMRRFGFGIPAAPNAQDFARAILETIEQRGEWDAMGRETRRVAEQHFDWDTMCERLFEFLSARLGLVI